MSEEASFRWPDYVILVTAVLVALGIGVYQAFSGGRQRTTSEYLTGNRRLRLLPVLLSIFMSNTSAILVLGNTAEMYLYGTQMWIVSWGVALSTLISSYLFVPLIYPLKITSVITVSLSV